jgi:2-polyprenyl-6-methoxyphenol hydroxylase-like FAD-dependent oxidoreductase
MHMLRRSWLGVRPAGGGAVGGGRVGGHAVVLGGGIAGLFATVALARHFDRVTLIERDELPTRAATRVGVPQGDHVHGLLFRGFEIAEELLPGFAADLRRHGAPEVNPGADIALRNALGWSARFATDETVLSTSRQLLEHVIRARVVADPAVRVLSGQRVEGLTAVDHRVTGVRVRPLRNPDAPLAAVAADFVVDATGRASQAPRWLAECGFEPPTESVVDARIGYASRIFRAPAEHAADWLVLYVQLGAPHQTRGGILVPIERDRWLVTLTGVGDDRPGSRDEDFLPFARSLASPAIADAIAGAEPVTTVSGSQSTSNRRRYFERIARPPGGFVAIGDATCCFNPIYAQGMTNSGLAATLLDRCLAARSGAVGDAALARDFHRRLAKLNNLCWTMSTSADSRFPGTAGARPTWAHTVMARFIDRTMAAGNRDARVQEVFAKVANLVLPPSALLRPAQVARVIRSGRAPATPVPEVPPARPGHLAA